MGEENGDHADSMSTHPHLGTVAIPLSRDQKPYRKDERNRVKQRGASIMSMGQMVGEDEMHEDWGDVVPGEVNIDEDVCSCTVNESLEKSQGCSVRFSHDVSLVYVASSRLETRQVLSRICFYTIDR